MCVSRSVIATKALDPESNKLVVVDVKPHPAVAQRDRALALMNSVRNELNGGFLSFIGTFIVSR